MAKYHFCGECGNPLTEEDQISCPKCGSLLEPAHDTKTLLKIKTKKNLWANFSWILLLFGSTIGLLSLFTPAARINLAGLYKWDMWMFGYNIVYDWEVGVEIFWTQNEDLFGIAMGSTIFIIIGNIISIVGAGSLIRKKDYGSILSIVSPIILFVATLFFIIANEIYSQIYIEVSFWELFSPGLAIIGQFLALGLMFIGFLITRIASRYTLPKRIDEYQEKVYQMMKKQADMQAKLGTINQEMLNKLEVISLRFKSIDILYQKLELLASKEQFYRSFDDFGFQNALGYMERTVELSPNQATNLSKIDLELAAKIIVEQDLKRAINYFKEIKRHTSLLLSEILINPSYRRILSKDGSLNSRIKHQWTLSYSELMKLKSTSNLVTNSEKIKSDTENLEKSSQVDSQKFPPISELMKQLDRSSKSDEGFSNKEKNTSSKNESND
ncbi:MAG: hypothetical protein ACFFDB_18990 [Promethearchaeota archaeon]